MFRLATGSNHFALERMPESEEMRKWPMRKLRFELRNATYGQSRYRIISEVIKERKAQWREVRQACAWFVGVFVGIAAIVVPMIAR
jgi:hypothetical protein